MNNHATSSLLYSFLAGFGAGTPQQEAVPKGQSRRFSDQTVPTTAMICSHQGLPAVENAPPQRSRVIRPGIFCAGGGALSKPPVFRAEGAKSWPELPLHRRGFWIILLTCIPFCIFLFLSSQRRPPYELSVSIHAHPCVLFSGRDLSRPAAPPRPGQRLRPAASAGGAPPRHREARAGQGGGTVSHRHLPAAVRARRCGRHGALGRDGRDAAAHPHRHRAGDGARARERRPHHTGPHQPPRCKKGGRT